MKWTQIAQLVFAVIAAIAVYAFVTTAKDGERRRVCTPLCALAPRYAARNRVSPDFELGSTEGRRVKLSDFRGKVVILNFWTKNCNPCLQEMPQLAELAKILREHKGIELVTVSTDNSAQDVKNTLKSVLGADAPFLTLVDADAGVVNGKFGTKLYPETWFIDPDGVIRARVDGARKWATALTVDYAESLKAPIACSVEFSQGAAVGPLAAICEDVGASG
jgi:thiol-disulfide isomerase/thioredoxin